MGEIENPSCEEPQKFQAPPLQFHAFFTYIYCTWYYSATHLKEPRLPVVHGRPVGVVARTALDYLQGRQPGKGRRFPRGRIRSTTTSTISGTRRGCSTGDRSGQSLLSQGCVSDELCELSFAAAVSGRPSGSRQEKSGEKQRGLARYARGMQLPACLLPGGGEPLKGWVSASRIKLLESRLRHLFMCSAVLKALTPDCVCCDVFE